MGFNFQIGLFYCRELKEMFLLDDNLMLKEEKELRRLLPISALLHNCLVLALSKESYLSQKKKILISTSQDGVDRDFWKFGCVLICHDKSELNFDKFLVFNQPSEEEGKSDALKKELQRCHDHVSPNIFQYQIFCRWLSERTFQERVLLAASCSMRSLFQVLTNIF